MTNQMIKIKLDIAGFYFGYVFEVAHGSDLREAMKTINGVLVNTVNGTAAILNFEGNDRRFLDRIQVTFPTNAPQTRQVNAAGHPLTFPTLVPGVYAARDETRVPTAAGVAELTWQYYVNAADFDGQNVVNIGAPLNREPAGSDKTIRQAKPFGDFILTEDCLVTWRLIAIMVSGDPLPA